MWQPLPKLMRMNTTSSPDQNSLQERNNHCELNRDWRGGQWMNNKCGCRFYISDYTRTSLSVLMTRAIGQRVGTSPSSLITTTVTFWEGECHLFSFCRVTRPVNNSLALLCVLDKTVRTLCCYWGKLRSDSIQWWTLRSSVRNIKFFTWSDKWQTTLIGHWEWMVGHVAVAIAFAFLDIQYTVQWNLFSTSYAYCLEMLAFVGVSSHPKSSGVQQMLETWICLSWAYPV